MYIHQDKRPLLKDGRKVIMQPIGMQNALLCTFSSLSRLELPLAGGMFVKFCRQLCALAGSRKAGNESVVFFLYFVFFGIFRSSNGKTGGSMEVFAREVGKEPPARKLLWRRILGTRRNKMRVQQPMTWSSGKP